MLEAGCQRVKQNAEKRGNATGSRYKLELKNAGIQSYKMLL
jgi:hypothetical protein